MVVMSIKIFAESNGTSLDLFPLFPSFNHLLQQIIYVEKAIPWILKSSQGISFSTWIIYYVTGKHHFLDPPLLPVNSWPFGCHPISRGLGQSFSNCHLVDPQRTRNTAVRVASWTTLHEPGENRGNKDTAPENQSEPFAMTKYTKHQNIGIAGMHFPLLHFIFGKKHPWTQTSSEQCEGGRMEYICLLIWMFLDVANRRFAKKWRGISLTKTNWYLPQLEKWRIHRKRLQ